MAGFSFPPPPPPPPRSTAPEPSAPSSSSQRGGYSNNFRSDRGGRGNQGGRGRGQSNNYRGGGQQQRGGHGFQQPRNPQAGGDRRQEHAGRSRGQIQQYGHNYALQEQPAQYQYPPTSSNAYGQTQVPVSTYVNPNLSPVMMAPQMQNATPVQPQIDPMAFMQAFSTFMVSQAGMQNVPAQVNPAAPSQYQASPPRYSKNQRSPPTVVGNKRKRSSNEEYQERHVSKLQTNASTKSKPAKAKVNVPPTVPSFGITLPTVSKPAPPPPLVLPKAKKDAKKAKRGNLLGLTPQADHSDSEPESIDEEATYAVNVTGLIFEYNGETAALNSPAEIAAWIRERRRLYPTKARAKQKLQEDRLRLANEHAILLRVKEEKDAKAGVTVKSEKKDKKTDQRQELTSEDKRKQVEHERQLKKIEKLRKKLQKSEEMLAKSEGGSTLGRIGTIEVKTEVKTDSAPSGVRLSKNNLGLDYGSDTESTGESADSDDSSDSSDSDSDSDSVSESESDDEDSAPEEETSKAHLPLRVSPPKDALKRKTAQTVCPYQKRSGKCTNKRCKFSHPPEIAAKEPKKRVTLYDRMIEQEEKVADMLALQAIKYLGSTGFLS
ncbi:uncharacterized protein BDZ99DRAFT_499838 [Mytilinidion resinicola]|uniref:C3H1-type domain-containing protein n=1 Tax=Mytilinidion resinicola TaxID=574789 RepID=A0A6A6YKQ6_9PEZI|nr:uncharacterized protein BDZ99DRAFT_499838 [Mytilinidion resinicola]KAF2808554.1 hypothetical protein BDZ99DRAFT_499838 [Mytilinidion resinicola]